jgi:hypothetical protein
VSEEGKVLLRDVGWGYPWLDQRWVSRSRGLRMQDQPDYLLGSWAAEAYRCTAIDGVPRVEDVDAITVAPHLGQERIRYTRLILPVATRWGDRCLLGASVVDAAIDLRAARPK